MSEKRVVAGPYNFTKWPDCDWEARLTGVLGSVEVRCTSEKTIAALDALYEAQQKIERLREAIGEKVDAWRVEGRFLRGSGDSDMDRAGGRVYLDLADELVDIYETIQNVVEP